MDSVEVVNPQIDAGCPSRVVRTIQLLNRKWEVRKNWSVCLTIKSHGERETRTTTPAKKKKEHNIEFSSKCSDESETPWLGSP